MKWKILNKTKPLIVVHNGSFHTDDCFAVASVLCFLKKNEKEVKIVRSRDQKDWLEGDYVIDVGEEYDAEKNRFDHHQKNGAGKRENGIPYAAFGLVWKKFGEKICGSKEVAEDIDFDLVQPIDANDNGVSVVSPVISGLYPYSLDQFVLASNPQWKENADFDGMFSETMLICKKILERQIIFTKSKQEAEKEILKDYNDAGDKRIIILRENYPWHEVMSDLPEPLFSVYPRPDGSYGVKSVRDSLWQFKNRRDLPKSWAGKRNKELQETTGVPDAIFCHNNLFMAVAGSRDGAIALAKKALEA